ncbi:acyltransferase family protein [Nocardioides sp. SYSU DS0663]|uniref:acyltransferase family protein n=1 Tax=Nocardioides sp. SYSU DS0663 TaxID=3416445 RepID=UPI003F4BED17
MADRMAWMDALRGYAVLAVVAYHAALLAVDLTGGPSWLVAATSALSPFRMAALTLLSGMLLARSLAKGPAAYLAGKLHRIAWPYVVWSLALVAAFLALDAMSGEADWWSAARPVVVQDAYTWYLLHIFVFYVAGLVCRRAPRTALIAAGLGAAYLGQDVEHVRRFFFLFAFFFLGDLLVRRPEVWRRTASAPVVWAAAAVAAPAGWLAAQGQDVRYQALWALPAFAGILVAAQAVRRTESTWAGARAAAVGRSSMVYYLAHFIPMLVAAVGLREVGVSGVFTPLLLAGVGVGAGWLLVRAQQGSVAARWAFAWSPARVPVRR